MEQHARHWIAIDRSGVQPGDLVSAEAGGLPVYCVLSLDEHTVSLREPCSGRDLVAPLSALHWKLAQ